MSDPRTPSEAIACHGLSLIAEARIMRRVRPVLPGETLPPEPPVWGVPGPELPKLT